MPQNPNYQNSFKNDVLFMLGVPKRIKPWKSPKYKLSDILQAIENLDGDIPLQDYEFNNRKWRTSPNGLDRKTNLFLWEKCTITGSYFIKVLKQGGWDVPLLHWEYIERPSDILLQRIAQSQVQLLLEGGLEYV